MGDGNGNSIINFGDLSKPATVLVEKVSEAVGGIFKPIQVKRMAKAEAEADKIRALTAIEISDIQERALHRLVYEEGKKQENIESITTAAIKQLEYDADPAQIDNDWLTHFFERAKLVSDTEMQSLWSRLLAGEANSPGAYSKRTIELIGTLDRRDAARFTELCTYVGRCQKDLILLVLDFHEKLYEDRGITFGQLCHLEDVGLIKLEGFTEYALKRLPKTVDVRYYGTTINVTFAGEADSNSLNIGHVILTKAGRELAPICGATADASFPQYLVERWRKKGHAVTLAEVAQK